MNANTASVAVVPEPVGLAGAARQHVDRLALLLAALLLLLPFVLPVHRRPQPAFDAEWLAAMLVAGAAIALGAMRRGKVALGWPLPAWLAAMVGIVAIQNATGRLHDSSQLVLACLYAFAIFGGYWVGRALDAAQLRERATVALAWALVTGALFSILIQWLQLLDVKGLPGWLYFELHDPWYRARPFANLGQVNVLSTYYVWTMVGVMLLLHRSPRPALAWTLMFMLAMGVALTRSRMGLVFSAGVVAAFWLPWVLRPQTARLRGAMTLAIVLGYVVGTTAVALLVVYQGATVGNAIQRFGEAGSFAIRAVMWTDALRVAATAPWLGVGFGDYAAHQYWIAQPVPHVETTRYVHNRVLQTAAELGWPMAVALCALAAWWFLAQRKERLGVAETAFAWALLAVIGVHSLLEWPLESLHLAIPAALFFALAEPRLASARAGTFGIDARLLVAGGIAGWMLALPMKLEFDEINGVTERLESERRSAQGVSEVTVQQMLALGQTARLRTYADSLIVHLRAPNAVEATDEEIARHERLLVAGADPRLIARLVILYAKAGRMDESVRNAERLRVFHRGQYAETSRLILGAIEPLGAAADPVRRQLAAGAPRAN
jgi:O-antigen ligase